MAMNVPSNEAIARMLEQTAHLLEIRDESRYRVRAFRKAAQTVAATEKSVGTLAGNDGRALRQLPGIGDKIASRIPSSGVALWAPTGPAARYRYRNLYRYRCRNPARDSSNDSERVRCGEASCQ
jgi:hypothetical protein